MPRDNDLFPIPYDDLKESPRNYKIMILHDSKEIPFNQIKNMLGVSNSTIRQCYYKMKRRQIRLYENYIRYKLGQESLSGYSCLKVFDFYQNFKYVAVYLEKKFPDTLREFRRGEPGASEKQLAALPAYRETLPKDLAEQIVCLFENEKKTFIQIGKEFQVTPEKAKDLYDRYYNNKRLEAEYAILDVYPKENYKFHTFAYFRKTPKARLEQLLRDYPEVFQKDKP